MASGMEMMLKAMGFDPIDFKNRIENGIRYFTNSEQDFKQRLDRLEKKIDILISLAPTRAVEQSLSFGHLPVQQDQSTTTISTNGAGNE